MISFDSAAGSIDQSQCTPLPDVHIYEASLVEVISKTLHQHVLYAAWKLCLCLGGVIKISIKRPHTDSHALKPIFTQTHNIPTSYRHVCINPAHTVRVHTSEGTSSLGF